jgi:hypothetical protein
VTGRRGRRRRKLLDDLKERRGYCHLKEEALDRAMWRNRFGRGVGPVVRLRYEMKYVCNTKEVSPIKNILSFIFDMPWCDTISGVTSDSYCSKEIMVNLRSLL